MSKHDRRTPEMARLRIYMDAVQDAKATTNEEWLKRWVASASKDTIYVNRESAIQYFEACIMREVNSLLVKDAA